MPRCRARSNLALAACLLIATCWPHRVQALSGGASEGEATAAERTANLFSGWARGLAEEEEEARGDERELRVAPRGGGGEEGMGPWLAGANDVGDYSRQMKGKFVYKMI